MDKAVNLPLENPPDAARLIYGLRDTGYSFNTAAADIIDNSIAANASEVNVQIELFADGRKTVMFGDNGDGMDENHLHAAMRYGAQARQNLASLGKFGLGLKTASSSVCLRFTVISRSDPDSPLAKLAWDLEHVEKIDRWEMVRDDISADDEEAFEELCGDRGTLVIWQKCDRILPKEYRVAGGTHEQNAIKKLAEDLSAHAALIYYRFLDRDDSRERNVTITVNGERLEAWNPFFEDRSEQVFDAEQQTIEMEKEDGSTGKAQIRAWILPHSGDLSKEENQEARISNDRQGFYILREGRVIQQGGWLGMYGREPHLSLLRIEFDFRHDLDDAFKVDVKKSRIHFDPGLEDYLKKVLAPVRREAGNRYRRTNEKQAAKNKVNHKVSNNNIARTPSTKKPGVTSADPNTSTGVVSNNHGVGITIKAPVQNGVDPDSIHVEAVDDIKSGHLYEPTLRSTGDSGYVPAVRISRDHDFYQKIYQRARGSGFTVQGMDLLLWAFAVAEQNNTNEELDSVFEDLREEISGNLRKLLRDLDVPDADELGDALDEGNDD